MKETHLQAMPISQLLCQRAFLKRIHALGRSAEKMRESHFGIIKRSPGEKLIITPPQQGTINAVGYRKGVPPELSFLLSEEEIEERFGEDFEEEIIDVHNHPFIGHIPNYAWTDFFSAPDIQNYLHGGQIGGLVTLPSKTSNLLLLLTQHPRFPFSADEAKTFPKNAVTLFAKARRGWNRLMFSIGREENSNLVSRRIFDINGEEGIYHLEKLWTELALEALQKNGAWAAVIEYRYSWGCSVDRFLELNRDYRSLCGDIDKFEVEARFKKMQEHALRQLTEENAADMEVIDLPSDLLDPAQFEARTSKSFQKIQLQMEGWRFLSGIIREKLPGIKETEAESVAELLVKKGLVYAKEKDGFMVFKEEQASQIDKQMDQIGLYDLDSLAILCQIDFNKIGPLLEKTQIRPDIIVANHIRGDEIPIFFISPLPGKEPHKSLKDIMQHYFGVDAPTDIDLATYVLEEISEEKIVSSWKELFLHPEVSYWDKMEIVIARGRVTPYTEEEKQFIKKHLLLFSGKDYWRIISEIKLADVEI